MIFVVTDPRNYKIRMTDECWYNHILVEHPEMNGRLDDMKSVIESPDYIYESKYKTSSHLYFQKTLDGISGVEYILVVVTVNQKSMKGYVQTAFLVV